jgi:hypothetical protein
MTTRREFLKGTASRIALAIAPIQACADDAKPPPKGPLRRDVADTRPLGTLAANTVRNLGPYANPDPRFTYTGLLQDGRHVDLIANSIIDYSGTAYDPVRRRIYLFGGGHGQSQETDVRSLDLETLAWSSLYPPTDPLQMNDATLDAIFGRWSSTNQPTARHTANMCIVRGDRFYMMAWQGMPDHLGLTQSNAWGGRPCWLDLNTLQWSYSNVIPYYESYIAACLDPVSQKILVIGDRKGAASGALSVYDPDSDSLALAINTPGDGETGYSQDFLYHPPTDTFFVFQSDGRVWQVALDRADITRSKIAAVTTSGTGPSNPRGIVCGFAFDPVNNLFGGNVTDGTIYLFDPTTREWSMRTMVREDATSGVRIFQSFHNIEFDTATGCYVFLGSLSGPGASDRSTAVAWAYRFDGRLDPASVAPSASTSGAYRYNRPYLFASIGARSVPSKIAGGSDFDLDTIGVQYDYVDLASGWAWTRRGGDWVDRNGARQGTAHWIDVPANRGSDQYTAADYSVDVTDALRMVQTTGRWNAWVVQAQNAPRVMAGRFHETAEWRPRIDVTYTDRTAATLACRVAALLDKGTTLPSQSGSQYSLPMAVEFERPTKEVASATLRFTITQHWSGSANPRVQWSLADPPVNNDPVTTGYASGYALDNGIDTDGNTIWAHRYADGTQRRDVILHLADSPIGAPDWFNRRFWSPHLWQPGGAVDKGKLPFVGAGKWVGGTKGGAKDSDPNWNVVPSTYSGEGFVPLAPGIGAMRVHMPADTDVNGKPIVDGSEVGQNGTLGLDAKLFMPEAEIGVLKRVFVRYYVRVGTPYAPSLADKKQIMKLGAAAWTDMAGKFLMNASHATNYGGNSGVAGGGKGWSLRHEFSDPISDTLGPSPVNGGYALSFSWYDYQYNAYNATSNPLGQPIGHIYGANDKPSDHSPGQRGGLGSVLYADGWHCVEVETNLNSVDTVNAQDGRMWQPDGAVRMWLDGRLCYERTSVVLRALPAQPLAASGTAMPPIRDLGIAEIWFNWFHGGLTRNTYPRTLFITGLVVGRNRIGPMKT